MAEVNIKTRLSLRYDTLANWNSANPVLNKGEVAVVAIPASATGENTYGQDTKPSILFKVGDGTSNFKALPYASARAADVYAWAKAAEKPTYAATEISFTNGGNSDLESTTVSAALNELRNKDAGINQAITDLSGNVYTKSQTYTKTEVDKAIEDMAGEIQGALESDTNTRYQIVFDSTNGLIKLQSKDIGETSWKDISGQSFDLTTLTVAKAKGISTVTAAGGSTGATTFKMPLINAEGNFVEGVSEYSLLGKGITVERGTNKPVIDADIKGNAATATTATSATLAEAAKKDNKGNIIDEHYATKQALESLAQDVDELDYESVGAAAASHAHTKSEITDFAHTHSASEINYLGNKISAASGSTIQVAVDAVYDRLLTTEGGLSGHKDDKANPHNVTATQIGTYTADKIESLVQGAKTDAEDALRGHAEASNPHNITKSTVGLGNVLNVASYAKTETYTQDEVDDAIAAESKVITDGLATGAVQVYAAGRAAMDGAGQTISTTYATKTELTTGLSGKADSSALSQQVSRLEGLIDDAVEDVEEIANGKTRTYVLSYTGSDSSFSNSIFNSNSDTIYLTQSHKIGLIDGTTLNQSSGLKVGDVFLVKETNVPDRWVMSVNGSGTFTLAKMETAKVDLTPYVLASTIINGKELTDDIELTGDDIKVANDNNTSIADKFSEVDDYIDSFIDGSKVVGHAELADKATQDGDGNVIKDTYATKTQLNTLGTAFESVEWAIFALSATGQVSLDDESSQINSKLNEYMAMLAQNNLQRAQIIERGLKFIMVDPTGIRWQGHINGFDIEKSVLSIKFECDATETVSPYDGYDVTVTYKAGLVIGRILEKRFNPSDVFILNGGNAAGAY